MGLFFLWIFFLNCTQQNTLRFTTTSHHTTPRHMKCFNLTLGILLLAIGQPLFAQEVDWNEITNKDLKTVRSSLKSKLSQPANKLDAALYLMLLNNVESAGKGFNLMKEVYPLMDNKSAILYPMWLDQAVTGGYFTRSESRFLFYKKIAKKYECSMNINREWHRTRASHLNYSRHLLDGTRLLFVLRLVNKVSSS